ncbi:MAG TPA: DEAD/DEAH box helicase family protein [Bacteroidales bacterium]|nr:DEAD/DEAH box helicase family protein [Bacteroidales bacterium]HPI86435.1 DEAD/DEAH box helicase family protein [Bacteroidales bacterium]HPM91763.1 DEAD/DEAH box helicase family protein [Bacteroidales bacterium]
MKLYLQSIAENISFESLPEIWQDFDFGRFSEDKNLFDFQQEALKNTLKALHRFYKDENGEKDKFYGYFDIEENLDFNLEGKEERKTAKFLMEYEKDYPVQNRKISFAYFINRMSYWMATGSGKTLVIVKLIDLLRKLLQNNEIPARDILFLAHRDDLIDQFKNHVEQFNAFNCDSKINLKSLKEYDQVKHENVLSFGKNEITVFYYRSDLISDEQKEKIISYKNYQNEGKWYIILDEAHKGDKEDSKRQILYTILTRNGFLFNFSATFTDPRDYATCVFNFNLSRFIEEGYGKHIYISGSKVTAFRDKDDYSLIEKQKIVLKTLILLTYINKYFRKIRQYHQSLYHRPLLLTLVNSVDTEESDLQLFFSEIEKIAANEIPEDFFNTAREELIKEIEDNPSYEFEQLNLNINKELLREIQYQDITENIYNSSFPGRIEVLKIPGNRNEIIFKLQSSDKPFGLIKIGDISGWLKDKLEGYEINESFENESIFKKLNQDDSEINLLMGSRSFYEGWDSNRPNIVLFVNIGMGKDAKKFVLQSVGRGVRIEPLKNKRKRLQNLVSGNEVPARLFQDLKTSILPVESLYVFGTNAANLKQIIQTLREQRTGRDIGQEFQVNKAREEKQLLIPVYKDSEKNYAEENTVQKFRISKSDFALGRTLYEYLGNKVTLVKFETNLKILEKVAKCFDDQDQYFDFSESRSISDPVLILKRIFDYLGIRNKELERFKELEEEIVHFKKIRFDDGVRYDSILEKIKQVKNYEHKAEQEKDIDKEFDETQDRDIYKQKIRQLELDFLEEATFEELHIKYIPNHYYIPLIISEREKLDYLNHIITVPSEVKFLELLSDYLKNSGILFKRFDWWMFSKLDQSLDEVYIPYYSPRENRISRFKPDFIFWLKKGSDYQILFIDPKGTAHTDGILKIDGFRQIYEDPLSGHPRMFTYNGFRIAAKLFLMPAQGGIAAVPQDYRKYWFDNFKDLEDKI